MERNIYIIGKLKKSLKKMQVIILIAPISLFWGRLFRGENAKI